MATHAAEGTGGGVEMSLVEQKKATRTVVRGALKALSADGMVVQSAAINAHILAALDHIFTSSSKREGSDGDAATTKSSLKLGLYVHCAKLREVDTKPLLRAALALSEAKVYVPIVDDGAANMRFLRITNLEDDLEPKTMGIMEPKEFEGDGVTPRENLLDEVEEGEVEGGAGEGGGGPLDILLMPGLAFDAAGNRLGRGGGYYDAFIQRYEERCRAKGWTMPPLLALAYTPQVISSVPMEHTDRQVDALATPDGIVACTELGARLIQRR